MKKNNYYNKVKYDLKICLAGTAIIVLLAFLKLNSCGGGLEPYVPTSTGVTKTKDQFFLIDKGVAGEMFNVKKHQPVFRNIILTGNERIKNKPEKESAEKDSIDVASKEITDSTVVLRDEEIVPVLNIHRLH